MGSFPYPDALLFNHYFSFFQLTYFWKGNCQDPIFKLSRCSTFGYTVHKRDPTIISHEPPLCPYVTFLFSLFLFSFSSIDYEKIVSQTQFNIFSINTWQICRDITLSASSTTSANGNKTQATESIILHSERAKHLFHVFLHSPDFVKSVPYACIVR